MTDPAPPKSLPPRKPYPLNYVSTDKMHAELAAQAEQSYKKKYPSKPNMEIEEMKKLPYLSKTRVGTKRYHEIGQVIHALKVGLVNNPNIMSPHRAKLMKKYMAEKFKYTEEQINDFLTRKFTKAERMELYKRLSDNFNPDNDGLNGNARDLASALWAFSGSGFSLLCKLWIEPAKKKVLHISVGMSQEQQHCCKIVAQETGNEPTDYNIVKVVRAMSNHFDVNLRPYYESKHEYSKASFGEFVAGYLRFLDDFWAHWKERKPSWRDFEVGCKSFKEWCDEWEAEVDHLVDTRIERQREREAEKEQYRRDYEDTMRGLNW